MNPYPIKEKEITKAYETIKNGGLALIPTRVGYVLLGNADLAMQKMFELKGRPLTKPCVVLTRRDILDSIAEVPVEYRDFIDEIEKSKLLCGFILKRKEHSLFKS